MRVSVLAADLSQNCLGRAYVLAQLIEQNHEVEIVGPQLKNGVWKPMMNEYNYKGIKTGTLVHQFPFAIPDLLDCISGEVIYASKPRTTSYGLGLLATIGRDKPLILDIDDWESGFHYNHGKLRTYVRQIPRMVSVGSYYYNRLLEASSGFPDARTVSNRFLQNKFGGTLIPHARDTDELNPDRFDKVDARRDLHLPPNDFLVMFSGTPRPHKGVDDIAKAVAMIERDDVQTVVVGADESEYVDTIRHLGDDSIIVRGLQPFEDIPKWIAAADVIAIPQRDVPATRGQLPVKVFDAMAMAKPIVATDVSDLPIVLENCGLIVESGNSDHLREAIVKLIENKQLRNDLGQKARQKCIEKYSYDALAPVLDQIVTEPYRDD